MDALILIALIVTVCGAATAVLVQKPSRLRVWAGWSALGAFSVLLFTVATLTKFGYTECERSDCGSGATVVDALIWTAAAGFGLSVVGLGADLFRRRKRRRATGGPR